MATARQASPDVFLVALDSHQMAAYYRLVDLLNGRDRTLSTYHACAELVSALRPPGSGYGAGWVKALCMSLDRQKVSLSPSLAYRLIRFAELFPGPKGAARVRRLNDRVSWETVMRVLYVEDPDQREAILQRAADEQLPSRAVMALVREKTGYRRARGGRPSAVASTHPNRALRDLRVLVSKWPSVCTAWLGDGNNALKRAERLKPGQISDAFLADLGAVIHFVEEMAKTACELSTELVGLLRALREKRDGVK